MILILSEYKAKTRSQNEIGFLFILQINTRNGIEEQPNHFSDWDLQL